MATQPIYQFYAELKDHSPKIWRRFQTANSITAAKLGYILMTLFEMHACHLFCYDVPVEENFIICVGEHITNAVNQKALSALAEYPFGKNMRIELLYEAEFSDKNADAFDAAKMKIKEIVDHEGERMSFAYDYGDDRQVLLILEKVIKDKDLPGRKLPRVLEGAGYGIIEDCGGAAGLLESAKAFKKKKARSTKHIVSGRAPMRWIWRAFDMEDMNFRLKKIPRIFADAYEYRIKPSPRSLDLIMRKYRNK